MRAGGFVFFGELADLDEDTLTDPRNITQTFEIRTQNSVRLLDTREKIKVFWV